MFYEKEMASRLIVKSALELLKENLIVRTWGNISARISEDEFLITPSGRAYENMIPEDMVKVKISDLSYEGKVKPSSEKGIHAGIYANHPEINFVIHTHQFYASAICAAGMDTDFAPCAEYGLPGQKKLCSNVMDCVLKNPNARAILMTKHGAIAFGESFEEAMTNVRELEEKSEALYREVKIIPDKSFAEKIWLDDYAQLLGPDKKPAEGEAPEAVKLVKDKNFAAAGYVQGLIKKKESEGVELKIKPLAIADIILQNSFYRLKYSKLKTK